MKNRKGFTLTELLAVIAIMAILAVAAISGYSTMTKNSKKKTYESKVAEIENAAIKFAKETNLKNSTTISVNKLVVLGYFQPDESTTDGLSTVNNPMDGQNMICNLINITINDDIYEASYKEKEKDCNIADQDLVDSNINLAVRELNGSSIGNNLGITNNIADWTGKDVVVITSSSVYTNFVSVSYDFGGQTITKVKNTPSSSTRYVESDYNKVAIKDVKVMFNSEVTVTYNMADGTVKSRTIIVRIDKEAPTSRPVVSNDATVGSTKKVDLYLDDGNGSGVVGFYVSTSPINFPASGYIDKNTNRSGKNHGDGKFTGYNSYFYAQKGIYYVKVVDAVGNTFITKSVVVANFEPTSKTCTMSVKGLEGETWEDTEIWYNKSIRITGTTNNSIGSMGVKYIVNHFASVPIEKNLTKYFDGQSNNGILTDFKDQEEESNQRTYYLAMKGQGRNEAISYCTKRLGVDKTAPTATLTCTDNDCNKYLKTHRITITLNDDRSGFYDSAFNISIGWSLSKTEAPTKWQTLSGGKYKTSGNEKVVEFITNDSKYNDEEDALTGIYYMWVKGDSFEDKAHNKGDGSPYNSGINFVSDFGIPYDNTKPSCDGSGGDNGWYTADRKIFGTCKDEHSGCVPGPNSTYYSYDIHGNVTRTINFEINRAESPGEVYDGAGNHRTCDSDQMVRIDRTAPNAPTLVMTHSYNSAAANGRKAVAYTNDTWVNSDIKTAVYMTDARSVPFAGPSATDKGVIQSGIKLYQISTNGVNWYDYNYNYESAVYVLSANGTHTRYIRSVDNAGNPSLATTYTIKIDKTNPVCSIKKNKTKADWTCSDAGGSKLVGDESGSITANQKTESKTCKDGADNTDTCSVNFTYGRDSVCGQESYTYPDTCTRTSKTDSVQTCDKKNGTFDMNCDGCSSTAGHCTWTETCTKTGTRDKECWH